MKIDNKVARKLANKYDINLNDTSMKMWKYGLNTELRDLHLSSPTKYDIYYCANLTKKNLMNDPNRYKRSYKNYRTNKKIKKLGG